MALVILLVVSWAIGGRVLRGVDMPAGPQTWLYRLLVGFCGSGVIVLVTGSVSLSLAQGAMAALAALVLAYGIFSSRRHRPLENVPIRVASTPAAALGLLEKACTVVILAALGMTFVGALAPVTGWDACVAHIALPMDYAREGRILLWEGNEYSAYPHLAHCLFAFMYSGSGEMAVSLLSWLFAALACLSAYVLGCRVLDRRCGIMAAAIMATSPIFFDQAGTPSIDLVFCAFTLAALSAFLTWRDEGDYGWLWVSAFLLGSSCGIRHTGYLTCTLIGLACVWAVRQDKLRTAFWFGLIAILGAAPWLLRSAILVGNPFYPFFAEILGSKRMPHWAATALAAHPSIKATGLLELAMFPWNIVMRPEWYDGWTKSPGGLVLFLGIPGLIVGGRRARGLGVFSGGGLIMFFYFQRLARYLLPFLAPMMIVAALTPYRLKRLRSVAVAAILVSMAFGLALGAAAMHFKIPVALGLETQSDYLARRVERYAAFEWVNENVPRNETIFSFDRRTYYIKGRSYQNDEPLRRLCERPVTEQAAWFKAQGIQWVFVPVTYIERSPGHRAQFLDMVTAWKTNRHYFNLVKTVECPGVRSNGVDCVEIYEVR